MMRGLLILFLIITALACERINEVEKDVVTQSANKLSFTFTLLTPSDSSGISIRGMDIDSSGNAWFSASKGTIIILSDSGRHLLSSQLSGYEDRDFRDIVRLSNGEIFTIAIGSPGDILRSTDNGKSWKTVYHNPDTLCFLDAIEFWNDSMGIVVGDPVDENIFMLKTTDGGETWSRLENLPGKLEVENAFAASGTSISVGLNGLAWIGMGGTKARIFKTTDYGESWTVTATPLLSGDAAQGIYSTCFIDAKHGIVVGGNWEKHQSDSSVAYSIDGKTWNLPTMGVDGYRSCVSAGNLDGNNPFFVVCGTSGVDISFDFGKNWTKIKDLSLNVIDFIPGKSIGYAADSKGAIYRVNIGSGLK